MAHNTIVFSESQDPLGALVNVAPVTDQIVRTEGDDLIVPETNHILGAHCCGGTNAEYAQLISPSLRAINPYNIVHVETALVVGASVYGNSMHPRRPVALMMNEALNARLLATPGGAEQSSVIVFLGSGAVNPVEVVSYPVRFYCTLTPLQGVWNYTSIEFIDDLPVGNYDVVGMQILGLTLIAARLVFVGGNTRPGVIPSSGLAQSNDWHFRRGGMGVWGSFNTTQPPGIEVIPNNAPGASTYYGTLDLVKK